MATNHTPPIDRLASIRDAWLKLQPDTHILDEFGSSEVEAYWRTVLCLIGLRLKAVHKLVNAHPASPELLTHLEKVAAEFELCRIIGNSLFDKSSIGT